jgi:hypothetical protein
MRDRTKKPLAIILSDVGRGSRGRDCGSDLTSVQIKPIWNCCNEPPPIYYEYILIKKFLSGRVAFDK